ncbi:hypothetical protein [Acinetobacter towneri]|uniref:hypothetical protein n=1 Tax=Acinetobacter towneri TaxID=202956 RepID=UPI0014447EA4|nr:hypothetical protein [Acinetobacter towneri]
MDLDLFYKNYENYFKDFGKREYVLAWYIYCVHYKDEYLPSQFLIIPTNEKIKEELFKALVSEGPNTAAFVELLHLYIKDTIIPDEELEFIEKNNNRLIIWLHEELSLQLQSPIYRPSHFLRVNHPRVYPNFLKYKQLKDHYITSPLLPKFITNNPNNPDEFSINWNNGKHFNLFFDGDFYEQLITRYDVLDTNFQDKLSKLKHANEGFNYFSVPDKEISWISPDDELQLKWAKEYLSKIFQNPSLNYMPPSRKENLNQLSLYDQILIDLDRYAYSNPAVRTILIEKMKKSWSQKKYRQSGKTKKNYHLPLTKDCKKKLSKLSELMNKNENEVLEILINERYELDFLDEKGRSKY